MRHISKLLFALTLLLRVSISAAADDGLIGLYFDAAGTSCSATVPASTVTTLYVVAKLNGLSSQGITGAEFRVDGIPPEWFANESTAGTAIGSALLGGCTQAFSHCQVGTDVVLSTIAVLATTQESNLVLGALSREPPSNQSQPWTLLTLCDAPTFTSIMARGGVALINDTLRDCGAVDPVNDDGTDDPPSPTPIGEEIPPPTPAPAPAPAVAQQTTWSGLKAIYRD
jgi:hypothetical protein